MVDTTAYPALDDRLLVVRGESATERLVGHDFESVAASPDAPDRAFAGTVGSGIQRTIDGGDTWTYPQTGLDHRYVWGIAVPESDPYIAVVSAADGARSAHGVGDAESYVYRTTGVDDATGSEGGTGERGVEWTLAMDGLPDPEGTVRSVLTAGTGATLFALNNRGLYRSDGAGERWARLDLAWADEYESQTPRGLAVVRD